MKRRQFIKISSLGTFSSIALKGSSQGTLSFTSLKNFVYDPPKNIPIKQSCDVIVCGSGPAGVTAAIAAAREGAKTLLIETHGCLGGMWTSGLLGWMLDFHNKKGILKEIIDLLIERKATTSIPVKNAFPFNIEEMKLLLEELCIKSNVNIRLHTRVVGAKKNKSGRITHVITESKSGREAWEGKIFIDATGDGDLSALSGCGYDLGDPKHDNGTQPGTLLAIISGIDFDQVKDYIRWEGDIKQRSKRNLSNLLHNLGYDLSYKSPSIHPLNDSLYMLMANHEYGYDWLNSDDVTQATLHARKEVYEVIKTLRLAGKNWENIKLIATAEHIGVRESRRICGLYSVSVNDIINGVQHEDAVCTVNFGVDVHSINKEHEQNGYNHKPIRCLPYDIPLRALIAKDVDALMIAGRCISGDFLSHASYRVVGNASAMGEAAGKVAANAALNNTLPQYIDYNKLKMK
ncbi:FAD-dependent oxidoreductase [Parabacteroides johnsonii]|uniref:FAD-dependent oxidoreductase n=1 Tax=Parabacteroides johnsonii TaxID=387661 RepID=UPI0011DDA6DA|nr:FAD-dependent oxidoreductase [Parabacteroides johnsonii]